MLVAPLAPPVPKITLVLPVVLPPGGRYCSGCFPALWGTSTKDNLAPRASDSPETRLELLTRISSIRFFHFLISSRMKVTLQNKRCSNLLLLFN